MDDKARKTVVSRNVQEKWDYDYRLVQLSLQGDVDFPKVWHEKCRMCFTEEDLLYTFSHG